MELYITIYKLKKNTFPKFFVQVDAEHLTHHTNVAVFNELRLQ